jgi:hypothetical protein
LVHLDRLLAPAYAGWTITACDAINNLGQIAGTAINPSGQRRCVLLTPSSSRLLVTTQPPAGVPAGQKFDVQVAAVDVNGNVDTSFTGPVTIALANNPGGSTLGGRLTVRAVNGVADFSNLTLNQLDPGYTLRATATDLQPTTTAAFNVTDAAGGPYLIAEGQPLTLDASHLVSSGGSGLTYSWSINGMAGAATGINPTLTWSQLQALGIDDGPATFTVQVAADDSQGNQVGSASTTLTLNNTPPAGGVSGPTDGFNGVEGQSRTFTLTATDFSAADQAAGFSFAVNWGDGTSESDVGLSGLLVSHTYTATGAYTITVTATNEDGTAGAPATLPVTILAVEQQGTTLAVGGGAGDDAYTFTAGGKSGTVIVKDNGKSLGTFTTTGVHVYGGGGTNTVAVDGTKTGMDAFTITGTSVAIRGVSIAGDSVSGWAVNGGGGTNTFAINGSGLAAVLTGGPNADTFTIAAGVTFDGSANGGGGTDTLVAKSLKGAGTVWQLTGADSGTVNGAPFTGIANLAGGAGNDAFQFGVSGSVSGTITGGGGSDWLDYSASTLPVQVDLTVGSATGVNGGAAGGVSGILNVRGGLGNDTLTGGGGNILVGGGGNNVLTDAYAGSGRIGRSLLIAGSGGSTLQAGAAGDILIGGGTSYDNNNAALVAILAEWQSGDSYKLRFDRLEGLQSGGLNGSYTLNWGGTVLDNNAADTLIGSTTGLDWFFAKLAGRNADTILNRNLPGHEHVNNT